MKTSLGDSERKIFSRQQSTTCYQVNTMSILFVKSLGNFPRRRALQSLANTIHVYLGGKSRLTHLKKAMLLEILNKLYTFPSAYYMSPIWLRPVINQGKVMIGMTFKYLLLFDSPTEFAEANGSQVRPRVTPVASKWHYILAFDVFQYDSNEEDIHLIMGDDVEAITPPNSYLKEMALKKPVDLSQPPPKPPRSPIECKPFPPPDEENTVQDIPTTKRS